MTWQKHCLQMIEQLPIGVAVVLPDGVIEYANPCLARLLGLNRARLAGSALTQFAPAARGLPRTEKHESVLFRH